MAGINSKEMTKNDAMELSRVQFQVGELPGAIRKRIGKKRTKKVSQT